MSRCPGCGKVGVRCGECLCGGIACAGCSEFVANGTVRMTLGGAGLQAVSFLAPRVAEMFGAKDLETTPLSREVSIAGAKRTAQELRAVWLGGIPAQRPLQLDEPILVPIFDVGTRSCAAPGFRSGLPPTCPSCNRGGRGDWYIRPCGHAVCGSCALRTASCAICGNADRPSDAIVGYERLGPETTRFHTVRGESKVYERADGMVERVVELLGSFCRDSELEPVYAMLESVAARCMGPSSLSEEDTNEVLYLALKNAEALTIPRLVHALRQGILSELEHTISSCVVGIFMSLRHFKGQPMRRVHLTRAFCWHQQLIVAENWEAAVKIQAHVRGWLARRIDPRAETRHAAVVKIQALWKGWSYRRVCVICNEMGARCTQCKCRGSTGRAHADCILDAFKASGNWNGRCTVCKGLYTGKVGLWVAGHIHAAMRHDFDPLAILSLAEVMVEQKSNSDMNFAYRMLHTLDVELQTADPLDFGGERRHQETTVRVHIQLALLDARKEKREQAVKRLRVAMGVCFSIGFDHPLSLLVQMHHARILFDLGQVQDAHGILSPLLEELHDTFGPTSPETLYHGKMILAACALMLAGRRVKARYLYFETFESLRREFGPAHPYTLEMIRWRQAKRVGVAYTTSKQIEHECATKIQALWRGWAYRRPCYLCKKLGASNTCCGCHVRQRWAHPECRAKVAAAELCVLCHHCDERHTGWFGVKVVYAVTEEEETRAILDGKTWEHNRGDVQYALALAECRAPFPKCWDPQAVLDEIHVTNSDPRMVVWTQIAYGFLEYRQGKLESAELRLDMASSAACALSLKEPEQKMWWYMAMAYHGAVLVAMERYAEAEGVIEKYTGFLKRDESAFAAYYGRPLPWHNTANNEFSTFYGTVPLAFCRWKLGREKGKLDFSTAVAELRRCFGSSHDFVRHWLKMAGGRV
jgi:hypothetical protein